LMGTWKGDIKVDQEAVKSYKLDIQKQVVDRCPTKCMKYEGGKLSIDNQNCTRCMHCINKMTKALRPGDERGAHGLGVQRGEPVARLRGSVDLVSSGRAQREQLGAQVVRKRSPHMRTHAGAVIVGNGGEYCIDAVEARARHQTDEKTASADRLADPRRDAHWSRARFVPESRSSWLTRSAVCARKAAICAGGTGTAAGSAIVNGLRGAPATRNS